MPTCLEEAVDTFKRLFGSEALIDVVENAPDRLVLHFYGNMCYTCGAYDYFEDFAGIYSECAGEEWTVEEYRQQPDGTYIVTLRPKRLVKKQRRHVKIVIDGREEYLDLG